jgi:hypothetical protein
MNYRHLLITTSIALAELLGPSAQAAGIANSWQLNQLHSPSEGLARAEGRGRVTIYDGVRDQEINRAMDEQFDRIDNMMFIRTPEETPTGEVVYQDDDDC